MSIWDKEIVRVDGELKVYVKIQNDVTGNIAGTLRNIHIDGNCYYCRADGNRVDVTAARERFLQNENYIKSAVEYCKQQRGF